MYMYIYVNYYHGVFFIIIITWSTSSISEDGEDSLLSSATDSLLASSKSSS